MRKKSCTSGTDVFPTQGAALFIAYNHNHEHLALTVFCFKSSGAQLFFSAFKKQPQVFEGNWWDETTHRRIISAALFAQKKSDEKRSDLKQKTVSAIDSGSAFNGPL